MLWRRDNHQVLARSMLWCVLMGPTFFICAKSNLSYNMTICLCIEFIVNGYNIIGDFSHICNFDLS